MDHPPEPGAAADPVVVDDAWRAWRGEVAFADEFVADSLDLGVEGLNQDGTGVALRSVLVHMIEEYARHCGQPTCCANGSTAVSVSDAAGDVRQRGRGVGLPRRVNTAHDECPPPR
jgi:hypothetical protein